MEMPRTLVIAVALVLGIPQLVNAQGTSSVVSSTVHTTSMSASSPPSHSSSPSPSSMAIDLWQYLAFTLGGTTALFFLATCTLSICLCVVMCRRRKQDSKDIQTLVHQASFSVPISNQVYVENEKGSDRAIDAPGSTNTFATTSITIPSPPLKRNSTNSSIASGGYVEMRGGIDDFTSPQSYTAISSSLVPVTTTPASHTTQVLQHISPVSSTLPVSPLDYENATAWLLAEKIKEHDRRDYKADANFSTAKLKHTKDSEYQVPQPPPKPYKEIDFMTMEPSSEYMKPNCPMLSSNTLSTAAETEIS